MVSPLQGTAEEKLRTITATFKDLEQRMIPYMNTVHSVYKRGSPEYNRRRKELSRELNKSEDSNEVFVAMGWESVAIANQKLGWDPTPVRLSFFTEIARFYATASPQHRQEIAKLFKEGHPLIVGGYAGFANYAAQQMVALPDEGDICLGMALIIVGLEAGRLDYRETYFVMERLLDNAKAAGINPGPVIQEIAEILPPEGARIIDRSR